MRIGTLNARSLKDDHKFLELENETGNYKIDILGLAEVRRKHESIIETKKGNIWFHTKSDGHRGVGFLINKKHKKSIKGFMGINDRIATLDIEINKELIVVIQVHAPTLGTEITEIEEFYRKLNDVMESKKVNKQTKIIIIGDFNSQIGKGKLEEEKIVGPYYYGERNGNGDHLVEFCHENHLKILNTWFKKKTNQRWTWISPNMMTKNQIDYILVDQNNKNIKDCGTIKKFQCDSDHRIVGCEIEQVGVYRRTKDRFKTSNLNETLKNSKTKYENLVNDKLSAIAWEKEDSEDWNEKIVRILQEATNKVAQEETEQRQKIENPLKEMYKRRQMLINKKVRTGRDKIEIINLNKMIKIKRREYYTEKEDEMIETILEDTMSIKSINKNLSLGIKRMNYMVENGEKVYGRNSINEAVTRFYRELYDDKREQRNKKAERKNNNWGKEAEQGKHEIEPIILESEVRSLIQNLKNNKAPGVDGITNEQIKYAGEKLIKILTKFFNNICRNKEIPENWKMAKIILIFKKGDKHKIENYRPISIISNIAKVFAKVLKNRIKKHYNDTQPEEQAGFRTGYSTITNLHIINQILEKSEEYNLKIHLAFVDYTKAFDCVSHSFLFKAMSNQGYSLEIIKIIKKMYENAKAMVITDIEGEKFEIRKGVRQGDPLSSILFNIALEEVFRKLDWEGRGLNINGSWLSNLRFADDVVVLANNKEELTKMLKELYEESKKAGLEMNLIKTKYITNTEDGNEDIRIDNDRSIKAAEDVIYLGQTISATNRREKEITRRIKIGWNKYWALKRIFKTNLSLKIKSKVFNTCIIPAMNYGAQTWALREKDKNKLQVTQNKMEKGMLGIKQNTRISTRKVKNTLKNNKNIIEQSRLSKWDWAGHIARREGKSWVEKTTFWYLKQEKRNRGRQKIRWTDDFTALLTHKMFHQVAQSRPVWRWLRSAFARKGMYH